MQILPVIDLLHGQVVRGVGGRRKEYRPIVSKLTPSTDPLEVARAFRDQLGLNELYLADLDAIMGQAPALGLYRSLHQEGFHLWVDAGLRNLGDARILREAGVAAIVAGLETLPGPLVLETMCREFGGERIVFSLDMKGGISLGTAWPSHDIEEIARMAIAAGVRRLLVLDLAQVGEGKGTSTEGLCSRLAGAYPQVRIAAGGGIGGMDDVRRLATLGVQIVLIASALHDGRIIAGDLV